MSIGRIGNMSFIVHSLGAVIGSGLRTELQAAWRIDRSVIADRPPAFLEERTIHWPNAAPRLDINAAARETNTHGDAPRERVVLRHDFGKPAARRPDASREEQVQSIPALRRLNGGLAAVLVSGGRGMYRASKRGAEPMAVDSTLITAIAAVAGSIVGSLSTCASAYVTQRRQSHIERVAHEVERREDLYARFNELAAKLALDALESTLDEPAKLVGIATLAGQIRLVSSSPVLTAAEAVIADLLASYQRPPVDPREVIRADAPSILRPLVEFTYACRAERQQMLRGI